MKGTTEDGVHNSFKMPIVASRTPTAVRSWCSAWSQMPKKPLDVSMAKLHELYRKAIRCLRGSWEDSSSGVLAPEIVLV